MQKIAQQKLSIIFWIVAAADICSILFTWPWPHYIFKALLIPALIMLWRTSDGYGGKYILLIGLIFSWLGDVLLMLEPQHKLFFIFGLAAFLTTHIFYIVFFLKKRTGRSLLAKQPWWLILVPAYGVGLVWFLYPKLGDLRIPVIAYATVICTMLLCSIHVFGKINRRAGWLYCFGAIFFVVSDSLLALNKFYQPYPYAGPLVMVTYCLAQFLIVRGFLAEEAK